jgi:hypothetical protein
MIMITDIMIIITTVITDIVIIIMIVITDIAYAPENTAIENARRPAPLLQTA